MSEAQVRCTSCGRSFGRVSGPRARCLYCGGVLAGPGLEHLELVDPDAEPQAPAAPGPRTGRVKVLTGTGPSRWERPITALQELTVLAMLLMALALLAGFLHRHDPLLPPQALRVAALALLPVLWIGGVCLRVGAELFSGPARSVVVALPLLAVGLAAGLPSSLARTLARLQGSVFGIWGLVVTLLAFLLGTAWLEARHDPVLGAAAWLAAHPEVRLVEPGFELSTTGWSGRMEGEGEGAFSLRIDEVGEDRFAGSITWVRTSDVDQIRGVYQDNQLVFPYQGPPWIERWWRRPGMLSTASLRVVGESQLEGQDLLFGHRITGKRVWMREPQVPEPVAASGVDLPAEREPIGGPVISPPVVLRPLIEVEDDRVVQGRAFALRLSDGAEPFLLTAASLFGPAGGLSHGVNPQMLPALVGEATFFDLLEGAMRARGQLLRPPSGARAMVRGSDGPPDASRDLVALALLPGHSLEPLALREAPVAPDLALWLPTKPEEQGAEELLLAARVAAVWEQGFSVSFVAPVEVRAHVGAPLLDGQGRVAGMVVGTSDAGSGRELAVAIPASWIKGRLAP
jgi:hypothetical protein